MRSAHCCQVPRSGSTMALRAASLRRA